MTVVFVFLGILKYKGRLLKQISTLQEAGYEVCLIHGQVEEPPPDYSQYKFRIVPVAVKRKKNRLLNFLGIMTFNLKAKSIISRSKPDFVVCVELYGALSGALFKKSFKDSNFIFDCNELFMHMGMARLKKTFWKPIHSFVFYRADFITHAEQNRLEYCRNHYRSKAKHVLLENLPNVDVAESSNKPHSHPLRLIYIGALLPERQCEKIIDAFAAIESTLATCDLVGFGEPGYEESLKAKLRSSGADNVRILPPIPFSQIAPFLENYDVGLAFYANENLNQYYCAPNKVYDYFVAQLPVITNDYPGLIERIQNSKLGVCVSDVTDEAIREALQKIEYDYYWRNLDESTRKSFTWTSQEQRYLSMFRGQTEHSSE